MRMVIAPGASGNAERMQPWARALRRRDVDARAIEIPKRKAEQAVDAYLAASGSGEDVVIGGQSYGGRVASLLAARGTEPFAGLVCFSYPLLAPGQRDWRPRTAHWPEIRCPVLFLSGASDPMAPIDALRRAVKERLPTARLATYPGQGHWLEPVLDEVLDEVAGFIRDLAAQRIE